MEEFELLSFAAPSAEEEERYRGRAGPRGGGYRQAAPRGRGRPPPRWRPPSARRPPWPRPNFGGYGPYPAYATYAAYPPPAWLAPQPPEPPEPPLPPEPPEPPEPGDGADDAAADGAPQQEFGAGHGYRCDCSRCCQRYGRFEVLPFGAVTAAPLVRNWRSRRR